MDLGFANAKAFKVLTLKMELYHDYENNPYCTHLRMKDATSLYLTCCVFLILKCVTLSSVLGKFVLLLFQPQFMSSNSIIQYNCIQRK